MRKLIKKNNFLPTRLAEKTPATPLESVELFVLYLQILFYSEIFLSGDEFLYIAMRLQLQRICN